MSDSLLACAEMCRLLQNERSRSRNIQLCCKTWGVCVGRLSVQKVSQVTNWRVSAEDAALGLRVCFRSRLTSVIAGLWAQETCDDVRRRSRGAALEFKSMSSQSNLLCVQSASFRRSLLNYGLIGHATKAADGKRQFLAFNWAFHVRFAYTCVQLTRLGVCVIRMGH